jgi:predicted nucleic acid-binding protein
MEVLPLDLNTARRFGVLKQSLMARGRSKADVDLHIAATAIEAGATLVTNDQALLAGDIPDLIAENWLVDGP